MACMQAAEPGSSLKDMCLDTSRVCRDGRGKCASCTRSAASKVRDLQLQVLLLESLMGPSRLSADTLDKRGCRHEQCAVRCEYLLAIKETVIEMQQLLQDRT